MAKDEKNTALTTIGPAQAGTIGLDSFKTLIADGFSAIDTVLIGDPNQGGKVPMYAGELIGPGEPIAVGEPDPKTGEVNTMPTFAFRPLVEVNGKISVVPNVTHIIPMSHVPAHACARIFRDISDGGVRAGMVATVGLAYLGKSVTRKGFQLNNFRVFEKYTAKSHGE